MAAWTGHKFKTGPHSEKKQPFTLAHAQFSVANQPNTHAFGLRVGAGIPGEIPRRHVENKQKDPRAGI